MNRRKLSALEGTFVRETETGLAKLPTAQGAQGIRFLCPKPSCGHMIIVWFANPLGTAPLNRARVAKDASIYWTREGDGIDNLSLIPSVWLVSGCGWHGHVQAGWAVDVGGE